MKTVTRDLSVVEPYDQSSDERKQLLAGVSVVMFTSGVSHFGYELQEDTARDVFASACEAHGVSGITANLADHPHLAQSLDVNAVPVLVTIDSDGVPISQFLGVATKQQMEAYITTGQPPV